MNPVWPLEYLLPVALFLAGVYLVFSWRSSESLSKGRRRICLVLRGLLAAVLLLAALNPGSWEQRAVEEDSVWSIMLDRSLSMAVDDVEGETRLAVALGVIQQALKYEDNPARVQILTFAEDLDPASRGVDELDDLSASGGATDYLRAGDRLLDEGWTGSGGLIGILLLSDGRLAGSSVRSDFAGKALARGIPVHVLPLGGEVVQPDLELTVHRRKLLQYPGQDVRVDAAIASRGMGPVRVEVAVREEAGGVAASQAVDIPADSTRSVSLVLSHTNDLSAAYSIEVEPFPGEGRTENNRVGIEVQQLVDPIRVLLVEGEPHWDTKFLVQLLRAQPHIALTTVHRVTQERFFRVLSGEQKAEAVRHVFPETLGALSRYDLVVVGKGADYFLDDAAAERLETWVREMGGGVLFFRGIASRQEVPALARLEPVEWGPSDAGRRTWMPNRSRGGFFEEVFPGVSQDEWQKLAAVEGVNEISRVKTFSEIQATGERLHADGGGAVPLFITRRVGNGIAAMINAEGLWQWDFIPRAESSKEIYSGFWPGVLQWMTFRTGFLPGQELSLRLSKSTPVEGEAVKVMLRLKHLPEEGDVPMVRIVSGSGDAREIFPHVTSEEGIYATAEGIFTAGSHGQYRLEAGWGTETSSALMDVLAPPGEQTQLSADAATLARLAAETGGRVISRDDIRDVVTAFAPTVHELEAGSVEWVPWWDHWMLLCLAMVPALLEWAVRRRNGLQ